MKKQAVSSYIVYGSIIFMSLVWGATWLAIKAGLEDMPPFASAQLRFALAAAILLPFAFRDPKCSARDHFYLFIIGVFSFGISYGVVYWGQQTIPSGLMAVLFATFPFFVAMFSHFFVAGEKITAMKFLGIIVGFGGIFLIFFDDTTQTSKTMVFTMLIVLISPMISALSTVITKRVRERISAFALTFYPMIYGGITLVPISIFLNEWERVCLTPKAILSIVYLAVPGTVITFMIYNWLIGYVEVNRLAVIAYLTPIVALALGAIVYNEPITEKLIGGTALVLFGIAITYHGMRKINRESSE